MSAGGKGFEENKAGVPRMVREALPEQVSPERRPGG